jgi:hypothetical protein
LAANLLRHQHFRAYVPDSQVVSSCDQSRVRASRPVRWRVGAQRFYATVLAATAATRRERTGVSRTSSSATHLRDRPNTLQLQHFSSYSPPPAADLSSGRSMSPQHHPVLDRWAANSRGTSSADNIQLPKIFRYHRPIFLNGTRLPRCADHWRTASDVDRSADRSIALSVVIGASIAASPNSGTAVKKHVHTPHVG